MTHTIVGVDIAKNVMQVHWVDQETGEVVNRPVKRAAFLEYFANRSACLIGMESCSGSQHWARRLIEMGHQVKLMPAKFVKAFNIRNKNDAADARSIWMATQMTSEAVAVKTEAQHAVLALHRMRQQLVKFRTMQINSLRGLLTEYGAVMRVSQQARKKCPALPEFWNARAIRTIDARGRERVLLTSLGDRRRFKPADIVACYERRWQIETSFREIKQSMLGSELTLRSRTVEGVYQGFWCKWRM